MPYCAELYNKGETEAIAALNAITKEIRLSNL